MNAVTSTWRQLVRRRLWPVAVLLVAALAAVPVLLTREPEVVAPVDPIPAVTTTKADDSIAEPVVAKVLPEDRSRRRRVLGSPKDPFSPPPVKVAKVKDPKDAKDDDVQIVRDQPEPATSGGSTGGGGTPVVVTEPSEPKKYFKAGTIIVRFGSIDSPLEKLAIQKLEPVPDAELPLLVYMGLTKDGKKAKFLVDASIEPDGDGRCRPHRSSCETIELAVGETEFLDVIDPEAAEDASDEDRILEQFQLDIVDIKRAGDDDVK